MLIMIIFNKLWQLRMVLQSPEVSVEMFACIVDARVLKQRDIRVQCLQGQPNFDLAGYDADES